MDRPGFADQKKLESWADSKEARFEFPRLIRRLILETTPGLIDLGMPAGEGVSSGSWDGTVRAQQATAFVPAGLSLWELSVDSKVSQKAEGDYVKRTSTPDGSLTSECFYVAAILRRWTKRHDWASKHKDDGRWKEVRAKGLDDIETWLEAAPVTWAWVSELLGLHPYGLRSAEAWWDVWSGQTDPRVPHDLVLAGREKQVTALIERLGTEPTVTTIAGPSLDESRAFIASVANQENDQGRGQLLARMAFVDELTAWRSLMESKTPIVLVPMSADLAKEIPSGCVHQVIVPLSGSDNADIPLPNIDAADAAAALTHLGLDEKKSDEAGRLARRSLTALRRNLAVKTALHRPKWAESPVPRLVRAILLVGSWSEQREADCKVIADLAGQPYDEIQDLLPKLASVEDPLISLVGTSWHLVSPYDAWLILRIHIIEADLKRLETMLTEVLGEDDPARDLKPEDRWKAALEGKVRKHSGDLRRGSAKALALLAVHGESISAGPGTTGSNWAAYLVGKLLKDSNEDQSGRRWSSLADLLPLLAEAAPDRFLDAVRSGTSGANPVLAQLFNDQDGSDTFSQGSPHPSLLWALEGLAWSSEYFGAAVSSLARLDELDPGGRLNNRPFRSLESIFCPWHPETSVSPDRRLDALDGLRKRNPDCAWRLTISMLPEFHGVHMPTHEPMYRDWKPSQQAVTTVEYYGLIADVVTRAIEDADLVPKRWAELLDRMPHLPPEDRRRVAEGLDALIQSGSLEEKEGHELWTEIHDLVGNHTEFADAGWALPEAEVQRLSDISSRLKPESAYLNSLWLFQDHRPHLGDSNRREDFKAYDEALSTERNKAIRAVDEEGGIELVVKLAREVEVSWPVGIALAEAVGATYQDPLLPMLESDEWKDLELAGNYFARRFMQGGWDWLDSFLIEKEELRPLQKARLLLSTRDFPSAWERAELVGEGVAAAFWTFFVPFGLGPDFASVEFVAARMMEVGRNAAALDLLGHYSHGEDSADHTLAELVAQGLEGLAAAGAKDKELGALSQYDFEHLFDLLERHRGDLGEDRVASLEWAFLPALGFDPTVPSLHERMGKDPNFYVEIVCTVYGPHSGETEETPEDERKEREAKALNGHRLLTSWDAPPGLKEGRGHRGSLRTWIDVTVPLLRETDRLEAGLMHFGHVLVSVPPDDDGAFPPELVRDILEELQSDEVDSGFRSQLMNRRGVTSRGLEDGGAQERNLVAKYRGDADLFADRWPRTAAIFRDMAKSYESEARRNDESAERFRQGLEG